MIRQIGIACLAFAASLAVAQGASNTVAQAPGGLKADGGVDIRVRQENMNNIPTPVAPYMHQDAWRFRSRAWGQLDYENLRLYARLANEWWAFSAPNQYELFGWPDELVVDNLYLDINNLLDNRLSLRIGRQDLIYGAGRVILEGTPGDGSRTIYFDAVKATVKLTDKSTLDVFGIYNTPRTDLHLGNPDTDRTALQVKPANKLTESGAGLVLKTKEVPELPSEIYYIWKHESDWRYWPKGAKTFTVQPARDVHTFGARTTPKLGAEFEGDFEAAVQLGRVDDGQRILAGMAYAGITWNPSVTWSAKPYLKAACHYLSGDDNPNDYPNGNRALADGTCNAWNPVWSRWPQYSEIYWRALTYQYDVAYWSNVIYPYLEAGLKLSPGHKLMAQSGPIFAAEQDNQPPAGGGGSLRGWLSQARYDFPLITPKKDGGDLLSRRFGLSGHLLAEVLTPGDYYPFDSMAYFLRWELVAKF